MEQEYFSRFVNFKPGNGEIVYVNPPRFSWAYLPHVIPKSRLVPFTSKFILQISRNKDFRAPLIDMRNLWFNFYNILPPLPYSGRWYWRVGYRVGSSVQWSDVRSFFIHPNSKRWDRSLLANLDALLQSHPRILFNSRNLKIIRTLKDVNNECRIIAEEVKRRADEIITKDWWINFPENDREPDVGEGKYRYYAMVRDALWVAFAYILFRDPKYSGFKERLLKVASWPKGGYASPEGAGPLIRGREDDTQINEFLGLFFDWFYNEMSEDEREVVLRSLEWRIKHTIYNFCLRLKGDKISASSILMVAESHQFENLMVTIPAILAIYEHSDIAKRALDLCINYLIGVTNPFGSYEGWNEGPGYGNSKLKWLLNALIYLDTSIPGIDFTKNPYFERIGDFFIRITPVGLKKLPFADLCARETYYLVNRLATFRKLAYVTGNGRFLRNWKETLNRLSEISRPVPYLFRPWIEYILPYYYRRPKEKHERSRNRLFKVAGWVTVNSGSPNSYEDYKNSVGMIFVCRPRGGYSHSYYCENAFLIHAFGHIITCSAGHTIYDKFSRATMSHNTILINGYGQNPVPFYKRPPPYLMKYSRIGYIGAWLEAPDLVYWMGNATNAYLHNVPHLKVFQRHILFVRNRYFVIFDDLQIDSEGEPCTFHWLYHIEPHANLTFDKDSFKMKYRIGDIDVLVAHIANTDNLEYEDRRGLMGLVNPYTGEDYREEWFSKSGKGVSPFEHNIWISNRKPTENFYFLAIVFPYKVNEEEPVITKLDNLTVKVRFRGKEDIISFNPYSQHDANIIVDYKDLRP